MRKHSELKHSIFPKLRITKV